MAKKGFLMQFSDILMLAPYGVPAKEKKEMLTKRMNVLSKNSYKSCSAYKRIIDLLHKGKAEAGSLEDVPFLPVSLFKRMELCNVPQEEIVKTMTSSGTTGQQVSKIFLDRETSGNQQKTLVKIVSDFTGSARMPMIILDCPSVIKNRRLFSARGAGILGFSIFARKKIFAFDDDMNLDIEGVRAFLQEHEGETVFMFGFTFMIWQYFYQSLKKSGEKLPLENAILIHGGGWKKLVSEAVSKEKFKECLQDVCGITQVHDYYGMVEQTGCIYMECECGHLHASTYSDIITRRMNDFSVCDRGEEGVIQVLSTIPESYPGHSILTEDVGVILGEDDCPCGRKGKYFEVHGRMKNAEVRGCSDTFERK